MTIIKSLGYATDIGVLGEDVNIIERDEYLVITAPSSPTYYWGNFLLFPQAPEPGQVDEWESLFTQEINYNPRIHHKTFGWDDTTGAEGASQEFIDRGYELERGVVLTAGVDDIVRPPKFNDELVVIRIETDSGWDDVIDHGVATREEKYSEETHRRFIIERTTQRRRMIEAGNGAWFAVYVDDKIVGDLGIIVTNGGVRYQSVTTHPDYRRQGICSTLVHHAAIDAVESFGAETLVMIADTEYHAAAIYESVGFSPTEKYNGLCWFDDKLDQTST